MKKLRCVFFGLAVLLSDVMCWVVGYRYSDMLWGHPVCLLQRPGLDGLADGAALPGGHCPVRRAGGVSAPKKPVNGQKRVDNPPLPCYNACNKGCDREK